MSIKLRMIVSGILAIMKAIDPADVERLADKMIDWVEDKYKDNPPVMKGCEIVRLAFSIEDND